ncbi:MAG: hypothetical protein K0Q64_2031, partial [Nitrobacter vulgaris]|nr:hypothetical protein [Nitrobacter vulgaris]
VFELSAHHHSRCDHRYARRERPGRADANTYGDDKIDSSSKHDRSALRQRLAHRGWGYDYGYPSLSYYDGRYGNGYGGSYCSHPLAATPAIKANTGTSRPILMIGYPGQIEGLSERRISASS